jgi:hypothetical protein
MASGGVWNAVGACCTVSVLTKCSMQCKPGYAEGEQLQAGIARSDALTCNAECLSRHPCAYPEHRPIMGTMTNLHGSEPRARRAPRTLVTGCRAGSIHWSVEAAGWEPLGVAHEQCRHSSTHCHGDGRQFDQMSTGQQGAGNAHVSRSCIMAWASGADNSCQHALMITGQACSVLLLEATGGVGGPVSYRCHPSGVHLGHVRSR